MSSNKSVLEESKTGRLGKLGDFGSVVAWNCSGGDLGRDEVTPVGEALLG